MSFRHLHYTRALEMRLPQLRAKQWRRSEDWAGCVSSEVPAVGALGHGQTKAATRFLPRNTLQCAGVSLLIHLGKKYMRALCFEVPANTLMMSKHVTRGEKKLVCDSEGRHEAVTSCITQTVVVQNALPRECIFKLSLKAIAANKITRAYRIHVGCMFRASR